MDAYDAKKGYLELMRVTGLKREAVKKAIREGVLPGYQIGKSYVVPQDAFDAFREGRWIPIPRPVLSKPAQVKPQLLHTRKDSAA